MSDETAEKRAQYEAAIAKFAAICERHPGDRPADMKSRIMAAIQEFGIVRRSTACSHLKVREQSKWCGLEIKVIRGFRHFCQELIADGYPVELEWRQIKGSTNEEACLVLVK
jgi:hypothetical protein